MTTILDHRGNPIQKSILSEPQTAQLGWIKRELQEHQVARLTPSRMVSIFNEAEQGNVLRQSELYEDMEERDGHLAAEMDKRQRALQKWDWSIEPPLNPSKEEKRFAEELDEMIRGAEIMGDILEGMSSAIGRGFGCLEFEGWHLLDKLWMPKGVEARPQTWFTLDRETRSEILLRDRGVDGAALQRFGWVVHKHQAKSGYLARGSLMRKLAWPFLWKNYGTTDLLEFLEIYGLPMRVGTYPSSATPEERATLLKAVVGLGHSAAGIIPEGMMIDFKEAARASGGNDPFMTLIEWCEKTESKIILGGTLTSQADGKTSTNALGDVHKGESTDAFVFDTKPCEKTLRQQLLYPISVLSGRIADIRRCPRFVFDTQEEIDFKMLAESLPLIVDMGMRIPASYAHELLRIPEAKDGEPVLTRVTPAVIPSPFDAPSSQPKAGPEPAPDDAKDKPPFPEQLKTQVFMAALTRATDTGLYTDQATLDRALDALKPADLQALCEEALQPVIDKLKSGDSAESAMAMLAGLYPAMNTRQLQESLARAMFVADIWGRINADVESKA